MSMDQRELYTKVYRVKRKVRDTIGTDLSYEFRENQVYINYCALCGEAQMAYEDKQLSDQIVNMLEEYADKVIAIWESTTEKTQ